MDMYTYFVSNNKNYFFYLVLKGYKILLFYVMLNSVNFILLTDMPWFR